MTLGFSLGIQNPKTRDPRILGSCTRSLGQDLLGFTSLLMNNGWLLDRELLSLPISAPVLGKLRPSTEFCAALRSLQQIRKKGKLNNQTYDEEFLNLFHYCNIVKKGNICYIYWILSNGDSIECSFLVIIAIFEVDLNQKSKLLKGVCGIFKSSK